MLTGVTALTKEFSSKDGLLRLKNWCYQFISKDMVFDGSDAEQYTSYYAYAHAYFAFIEQLPQDLDNLNPILYASLHGYNYFLATHVDDKLVNIASIYQMTPLNFAASSGCLHTVEVLLAKGADLLKVNQQNEPPLFRALFLPIFYRKACLAQKKTIFSLLLAKGPEAINYKVSDGNNILHLIVLHEEFSDLLDTILNIKPELVFESNNWGLYPIHLAILNSSPSAVQKMMQIKGVADLLDVDGRTPLHFAAMTNSELMVEWCYQANPSVINKLDKLNKTPLNIAQELENDQAAAKLQQLTV